MGLRNSAFLAGGAWGSDAARAAEARAGSFCVPHDSCGEQTACRSRNSGWCRGKEMDRG